MSAQVDQPLPPRNKAHLVKVLERRGTHSPRSGAVTVLALVLLALIVWLGAELVLAAIGQPPFLVSGEALFSGFFQLPTLLPPALLTLVGLALALIGLVLLVLAIAPGTLSRYRTQTDRFAFIADNKVLASALSAAVAKQAAVSPDQVETRVSARRVLVKVTPTSGHRLPKEELLAFINNTLEDYSLTPAPRASLQIEEEGVVSHG